MVHLLPSHQDAKRADALHHVDEHDGIGLPQVDARLGRQQPNRCRDAVDDLLLVDAGVAPPPPFDRVRNLRAAQLLEQRRGRLHDVLAVRWTRCVNGEHANDMRRLTEAALRSLMNHAVDEVGGVK
eukprot:6180043-Pleurochrysis_carterae.AAC.8